MIHLIYTFNQLNARQIPDRYGVVHSPKFLHSKAVFIVCFLAMAN